MRLRVTISRTGDSAKTTSPVRVCLSGGLPLPPGPYSPLPLVVPEDGPLLGPLDGERSSRHVPTDHRARSGPGSLSHLHRRDEHRIRPNVDLVADDRGVLVEA